ncbi:MAG: AAA family ATPase, partial [Myxococcales bacterium]|nr:AAA family ATPase [Myxococcales bacterium]
MNLLSSFLAAGGGDLAGLFPELRGVAGFVEPPVMQDGAAAQFRLFDAFSSFVRLISEAKPTVITLDDLHWSDKPTLQLLQHLARELGRMRVLVVCTYRDTDLVRTHPLSEALANLNRDPGFERVVLRGLSKEETRAYIRGAANLQPSSALVERVYEETEGNPFFLSEVVNLLTQEGTLASESVSDIHIPDGVREALGRRLDRISEEAASLLQVAAVVGREFTFDTMQLLHSGDDDALLNLIEEGLEARVVEEMEQPGRYRFTHALMQETLLGELSTTRRVRLHGQVGEALERRWGDRAEEFASRLATHFSESASLTAAHGSKAVSYLRLSAAQAEARCAWGDAASQYERAIELAREIGSPLDPVDEADILVAMARCYSGALASRPAWRSIRRALALFEESEEFSRYARALAMAMRFPSATLPPAERRAPLLELAIERGDPSDAATRSALLLARADAALILGQIEEARDFIRESEELAKGLGSAFLNAEMLRIHGLLESTRGNQDSAFQLYEAAAREQVAAGNPARAAEALYVLAIGLQHAGRLKEARDALMREQEQGMAAGLTFFLDDSRCKLLGNAVLRGDQNEIQEYLSRPWEPWVWPQGIYASYWALLTGDLDAMESYLPDPSGSGGVPWQTGHILSARAQILALAGDIPRAELERAALEALLPTIEGQSRQLAESDCAYLRIALFGMPPMPSQVEFALSRPAATSWLLFSWVGFQPRQRAEILIAAGHLAAAGSLLAEGLAW